MPTAAAATYVRTVLFRRRQSSSCARVKGFVLFGRLGGCRASSRPGFGHLHVPSRLCPLTALPVPLLPGLRHGSTLSATLVGDPGWLQRQPQKTTRLHAGRQSPPIAPGESSRRQGREDRSREAGQSRDNWEELAAAPATGLLKWRRLQSGYGGRVARLRVSSRFAS